MDSLHALRHSWTAAGYFVPHFSASGAMRVPLDWGQDAHPALGNVTGPGEAEIATSLKVPSCATVSAGWHGLADDSSLTSDLLRYAGPWAPDRLPEGRHPA